MTFTDALRAKLEAGVGTGMRRPCWEPGVTIVVRGAGRELWLRYAKRNAQQSPALRDLQLDIDDALADDWELAAHVEAQR